MTIRKFGTGEILLEEEDLKKESTKQDRDQALAEVVEEQKKADED